MENSFKNIVDSANSILILLPKGPYFDQVAAGLSLYLALEKKKNVAISCPSEMVVEFNRLVGVQRISPELGGKNLVLKFKDYNASDIERVTYDIENKEFRLSVIPKPQANPPEKEQIEVTYSGAAADTVILVGGANESHFPALSSIELATAKLVHIGIMALSTDNSRKIISFARSSSSVSELTAGYIKQVEEKIAPDVASNLLAGMHDGSKNFSTTYVTADTFNLASELMQAGGRYVHRDSNAREYSPRDFGQKSEPKVEKVEPKKENIEVKKEEEKTPLHQTEEAQEGVEEESAPKSWLEPKIFKGSSAN